MNLEKIHKKYKKNIDLKTREGLKGHHEPPDE